MLKPTANYRMSKSLKTSLALGRFTSKEQRSEWKKAMIGAELAAQYVPKISKNRDDKE